MVRVNRTTLKNLGGGLMTAALFLGAVPVTAQDDSSVTPLIERVTPTSNPTVFQDGMNVAPLARATIFVRDIEASLKLYRDILGLRPMFYQLHNDETTPPPSTQTPDTRTGDFALVFPTNDIHRLTAEITAAGYPIVSPPVPLIIREEYAEQPVEMMFRDPDGVLVNLVQAGVLK